MNLKVGDLVIQRDEVFRGPYVYVVKKIEYDSRYCSLNEIPHTGPNYLAFQGTPIDQLLKIGQLSALEMELI